MPHRRRRASRGEPLRLLDVALGILATFRACRFLTSDGFPPVKAAREAVVARAGKNSALAELATCPWCQSLWAGPLVALSLRRWPGARWLLLGAAISGGVGLLSTLDSYLGTGSEIQPSQAWKELGKALADNPAGEFSLGAYAGVPEP